MSSPARATSASLLLVLVAVCAPLTSSAGALVVSGRPSRGLLDGAVRLLSSVLATQSCAMPPSAGCVIGSTGGGDDEGDLVAAYGRNLQRPECAISMLDLGVEPVVASDGYTYRLSSLMTWCARFDYGSCTSPLTRETIRPEVYYNQDLEVVMNTWGDQVRRKRHGTTMSWVQRFCADTVVICPDGRSYTEEEAHKYKLRWCYLNRALKEVAMEVAALDVLSVQQQQDLEPVAERYWAGAAPVTRWGAPPHADDVAMCPAEWRGGRRCTCRRRPDADPDTVSGPAAFVSLGDAIQDNRPIRAGRDTPIGGRRGRGTVVVARTCRQSADQPAEGREDGQCGRIPDVRLRTMPPGSTMVLVVLAIGFPIAWSGTSSPTQPLVVQGSPPSPGFIARTAGCLSSAPCLPDVDRAPIGVVPGDDDAISDLIEEYGRGVDPPECPISMLDLDAEPVVASDGHTYRLSTLMDWCARFSRGRCVSPISQVPIRAEVYYNQDLEMVATSWSDQVRWWRHGVTLPWVQRFNASKAMICADGRSYTVAEVGAYHLITACYVNLALAEAAAKIAELGTFSTDQQEILRPAAERYRGNLALHCNTGPGR